MSKRRATEWYSKQRGIRDGRGCIMPIALIRAGAGKLIDESYTINLGNSIRPVRILNGALSLSLSRRSTEKIGKIFFESERFFSGFRCPEEWKNDESIDELIDKS